MSRELDAAIAELLGCYVKLVGGEDMIIFHNKDGYLSTHRIPHYSTDGNDMLELVRELQERGFSVELYANNNNTDGMAFCSLYDSSTEEWSGLLRDVAMPKVLAKAFYKAKTGKEWKNA